MLEEAVQLIFDVVLEQRVLDGVELRMQLFQERLADAFFELRRNDARRGVAEARQLRGIGVHSRAPKKAQDQNARQAVMSSGHGADHT